MNQESPSSSTGAMLLTFLAGAAVGAAVAALTTPKSGQELRGDIKDLALRAKRKAGDLAGNACGARDGLLERTGQAAGDLERGIAQAADDLRV